MCLLNRHIAFFIVHKRFYNPKHSTMQTQKFSTTNLIFSTTNFVACTTNFVVSTTNFVVENLAGTKPDYSNKRFFLNIPLDSFSISTWA